MVVSRPAARCLFAGLLASSVAGCVFRNAEPPGGGATPGDADLGGDGAAVGDGAAGADGADGTTPSDASPVDLPPDPLAVVATVDSATQVTLIWASGGGSTAGYRLAWGPGATPPPGCAAPSTLGESAISSTRHVLGGLSPDTAYEFRVCAINAAAPPDVSAGTTAVARTRPAPPPDPTGVSATPLSATRLLVSWISGGGSTAAFRLAYQPGTAPADCQTGSLVGREQIFGTAHELRGLAPGTTYGVRVCAENGAAPPDVSAGATASGATVATPSLPPCDVTVPLGTYTLAQLQTTLNAAISAGGGGDGTIAVCLAHGVVAGSTSSSAASLSIGGDNVFLFAADGDQARLANNNDHVVRINGRTNVRLHNLSIEVAGWGASGVLIENAAVPLLSDLRMTNDSADAACVEAWWGSTLGELVGLTCSTASTDLSGLALVSSTLETLGDTRIETFGPFSSAVWLERSRIGSIESTVLTTGGEASAGLLLRDDSHVDAMANVLVRRLSGLGPGGAGYALVCDTASGAGPDNYFVTDQIWDVTLCDGLPDSAWTAPLADLDGALYTPPSVHHSSSGGSYGCQTFPFDDGAGSTAGTDQRIQFGGACFTGPPAPEATVSGALDFAGLQAVLDAAWAAGDQNGDGLISIRFADGAQVLNNNTLAQSRVEIPGDRFYLYANPGDVALIRNERTNGSDETAHGVFRSDGRFAISWVNLRLESAGDDGHLLQVDPLPFGGDSSTVVLEGLTLRATGDNAVAIRSGGGMAMRVVRDVDARLTGRYSVGLGTMCGDRVGLIEDSTFIVGHDGVAVSVLCGAAVDLMRRVTLETTGTNAPALELYKDAVVGSLEGPSTIRTAGARSHGILVTNDSAIQRMDQVTIRRAENASAAAVAILADPENGVGPNNYFGSTEITDVRVCSEAGAGLDWEAGGGFVLADGSESGAPIPWTAPATHVPHLPGPAYGAQTFPFGAVGLGQGVVLGGDCP